MVDLDKALVIIAFLGFAAMALFLKLNVWWAVISFAVAVLSI